MTHYDTLGVAPDASPADVKRAYRKASSAAHPDREGGSTERQAAVNRAYDVLGDADRRRAYDEAGHQDQPELPTIEHEAMSALGNLFGQALLDDVDPVRAVRESLIESMDDARQKNFSLEKKMKTLLGKRDKVKVKDGVENIAHGIIDSAVADMRAVLARNTRFLEVGACALKLLADYRFEDPQPQGATTRAGYDVLLDLPMFRTGRF